MKLRLQLKSWLLICLMIGLLPCLSNAYTPKPKPAAPQYDQILSKRMVEQKLGRKLRLKEKLALRFLRRKLKKQGQQPALENNIQVKVKRIKGGAVKGYLCKIERDSVYILQNNPAVATTVIPVKNVKKIVLRSTKRKRRARGIALLAFSLFLGGSISIFIAGNNRIDEADGLTGGFCLGLMGMIAFGLGTLIAFFMFISLNTNVYINGKISEGKLEVLKQYFLDIC